MSKLFGSLAELVKIVFRVDNQEVEVQPNASTTYTATRTFDLPPGDSSQELVSSASVQTLTNKTIDGDDNTVQDLAESSLKTVLANANKFLTRDGSGDVESATKAVPSGTVVGTSDSQTLTNKTLDNTNSLTILDSNLTVQDNADNTKQLNLQLSGITTGTTRTLTVPDASTTLVGTDTTQTLTNKTLTSPSITTSIDLANQGEVRFLEQSGNGTNYIGLEAPDAVTSNLVFKLPATDGSNGHVLTTDGAGNLSFAAAGGGGGGQTTTNLSSGNVTVVSGTTLWHPNLVIDTTDTYTVNTGGYLLGAIELTVDGTLTINGDSRIL